MLKSTLTGGLLTKADPKRIEQGFGPLYGIFHNQDPHQNNYWQLVV